MALVLMLLRISFVTAATAERFGKSYWIWFFLGLFLPMIAIGILFCWKSVKKITERRAVENDEIFDHLFIGKHSKERA